MQGLSEGEVGNRLAVFWAVFRLWLRKKQGNGILPLCLGCAMLENYRQRIRKDYPEIIPIGRMGEFWGSPYFIISEAASDNGRCKH